MILLDIDGVVADWMGAACSIHGRLNYAVTSYDWWHEWGMTDEQFWAPIKLDGYRFYQEYVNPYPWVRELFGLLNFPSSLWPGTPAYCAFVTASPNHPGLICSKAEWIKRHGEGKPTYHLIHGDMPAAQMKALLAAPDRILIDDSDDNIEAFRAAGGQGILFPQKWNKLHNMTSHRMEYVRDCLQLMKGAVA